MHETTGMKRTSRKPVSRAQQSTREVQPPLLRAISDDELTRATGGASMVEYALLIVAP
jgi:hypothetical protein